MRVAIICSMLLWLTGAAGVRADSLPIVRVGTSGDYAPFSTTPTAVAGIVGDDAAAEEISYGGLDPEVARAWAQARGFELRFVRFRWPELLADLEADRFDVAMSGVTVRTERSLAGRFSVPVTTSGAVVLLPADATVETVAALDAPGTRIAVNAGGHLERVARAHFPGAELLTVGRNESVPTYLADGRADAVVTDTREAPHWLASLPGLRALGPFTRDRKAYLFAPYAGELAHDLDAWLLESEADGTLAGLRARHLGEAGADDPVAAPLPALLAAMDERLALMPLVAESKRESGAPVEARDRERVVVEAATRGVREVAARRAADAGGARRPAPDPKAVRRLFAAQIEAAKDVQRRTLAEPASGDAPPSPDLADTLRPALLRIGQRIAFLLVELPTDLEPAHVRSATHDALGGYGLSAERLDEIADALHAVATGGATRQ